MAHSILSFLEPETERQMAVRQVLSDPLRLQFIISNKSGKRTVENFIELDQENIRILKAFLEQHLTVQENKQAEEA